MRTSILLGSNPRKTTIKLPFSKSEKNTKQVFVVDDEASFTRMIKLNLEATGNYVVEMVNESVTALEVAKEFKPDIILLDVVMPGADGGDVALNLRNRSVTRNIPIIFVSAMVAKEESKQGFYQSGGEDFLAKPVDKSTLCGAIETVLSS